MNLEIKGKVIQVLEPVTGESAKGPWKKELFVIETMDQYPKKVCFTVWNEKTKIPQLGNVATVHFNAESREHNGRWYTDLGAWKIEADSSEAQSDNTPTANTTMAQDMDNEKSDNLPF